MRGTYSVNRRFPVQGYFDSGCWVRQKDPRVLSQDADDDDNSETKKFKPPVNYSDSSDSDDENADDDKPAAEDIATKDTDFVHVSEIDFAMFP